MRQEAPSRDDVERRRQLSEEIASRLDPAFTALGIVFLLVVLGETLVGRESPWSDVFRLATWVIWGLFGVEFVLRMAIAPSRTEFLRRNWWQLIFLLLPFLRFIRLLRALRIARAGRIVSSAIRTTRSATRRMTSRLGWLVALTAIVILSSAQVLYEFSSFDSFGEALYEAAYGSVTGQPVGRDDGVARTVELLLAVYSVVVFASLAGIVGAFLLERQTERDVDAPDAPTAP